MSFLAWIFLGLIAGFIGSKIVNHHGEGVFLDIILGIVGAIVGGFVASALGVGTVNGLNVGSIVIAVIGACLVLALVRASRGSRARAF